MRTLLNCLLICVIPLTIAACSQPVIIVPPGEPVQLAEPVEAKVFVLDGEGKLRVSEDRKKLPAGWWVLPDPGPASESGE